MNLMETLTLFMVIFSFLGLIVDVIRLTVEVVDKFYQKKHDDNKKEYCKHHPVFSRKDTLSCEFVFIPLAARST